MVGLSIRAQVKFCAGTELKLVSRLSGVLAVFSHEGDAGTEAMEVVLKSDCWFPGRDGPSEGGWVSDELLHSGCCVYDAPSPQRSPKSQGQNQIQIKTHVIVVGAFWLIVTSMLQPCPCIMASPQRANRSRLRAFSNFPLDVCVYYSQQRSPYVCE